MSKTTSAFGNTLAAAGEPPSSSIETVQEGGQPVSRTFQELQQRVRRGGTVYVTDDADRTVKAKLTDIWVAGERPELRAALSPSVAPGRDSILMGGLIGFGIGAVLGTTVGAEACLHEPRWHCAVKVGVPIAAIGALIGWLHK